MEDKVGPTAEWESRMDSCLDVMRCVEKQRPSSWRPRNALAETKNIHQLFNRWRAKQLGGRRHGRRAALREGRRATGRRREIYILQGRQTRRSGFCFGFWFPVWVFFPLSKCAEMHNLVHGSFRLSLSLFRSLCSWIPEEKYFFHCSSSIWYSCTNYILISDFYMRVQQEQAVLIDALWRQAPHWLTCTLYRSFSANAFHNNNNNTELWLIRTTHQLQPKKGWLRRGIKATEEEKTQEGHCDLSFHNGFWIEILWIKSELSGKKDSVRKHELHG